MPQRYCPECQKTGTPRFYPPNTGVCVHNHAEPIPVALETGTVIQGLGKTLTLERLSAGAMGITYKAIEVGTSRIFVAKEMLPVNDPVQMADNLRRFRREAKIQEELVGQCKRVPPPFPPGYGHFTVPPPIDREFMLMDFIPGQDLKDMLRQRGKLDELTAVQAIIELCDVLALMHNYTAPDFPKGIVHRDIKPDNIKVVQLGSSFTCVLLDFGIARSAEKSAATQAKGPKGTIGGTPQYWAPEQLGFGTGDVDGRTDIYALGAMLYELLTGTQLSDKVGPRLAAVSTDITHPDLQGITRKMLQINPAARYQTVEDLRVELVALYEATQPLPAHLQSTSPVLTPPTPTPVTTPPQAPPKTKPLDIWIRWDKSHVSFTGAGQVEYRQDISGRVVQGRKGGRFTPRKISAILSGGRVHVFRIRDDGGTSPAPATDTMTDNSGDFDIDQSDSTVPSTVSKRRILVRVSNSAGTTLCEESVEVERPVNWSKAKAAASSGANKAGHAASQLKWVFKGPWWLAKQAYHGAGQLAQARAQAQAAGGLTNPVSWFLALLAGLSLLAITLFVARMQVLYPEGIAGRVWPNTFAFGLMLLYASWRLRKRPFWKALRQAFVNPVSIVYYFACMGLLLRALGTS